MHSSSRLTYSFFSQLQSGGRKIAIPSDCKTATDKMRSNDVVQDGHLATIPEDTGELTPGFEQYTVSFFISKIAIVASHMLAHFVTKPVDDIEWFNDFPICLI